MTEQEATERVSRKPKRHELKILPQYYVQILMRRKKFELRKNDRDYQVGDSVILREWSPDHGYTGNEITVKIIYVLRDCPEYGLMPGYCIFGW